MIVLVIPSNFYPQGTWTVRWRQYCVSTNINLKVIELRKIGEFLKLFDSGNRISFIFIRCYGAEAQKIMKLIKYMGNKIYLDINDNHLSSRKHGENDLIEVLKQIDIADGIICSTDTIKISINREFPLKKIFILDDFRLPVSSSIIPELKNSMEIVFFGFSGVERHMTGVFDLIKYSSMLNELHDIFPVRLNIITNPIDTGVFMRFLKDSNYRVKYLPYTEKNEIETIRKSHCIFLPGATTPYTTYKTANREMLARMTGRPIYTPKIGTFIGHRNAFDDPFNLVNFIKKMQCKNLSKKSSREQKEYVKSSLNNLMILKKWIEENE